jgi:alkylhydroperoxidase/carboxymuconolactone decarboxylase family protein YurZ
MTYKVRIAPVEPENFTAEQAELVGEWKHLVFSRVVVNNPKMYRSFLPHIEAVIAKTALPPRDRQVIVLRMLATSNDIYELAHHITISRNAGISEEEIAAFQSGAGDCLTAFDHALIAATDELKRDQIVGDATWETLASRYSTEQLMEVVFVAGCYLTMAMLTKTFGMQLEQADGEFEKLNKLRAYT